MVSFSNYYEQYLNSELMEKYKEPCIIDLPRIYDPRGNLTFVENGQGLIPFAIERVYWTYDELIVATSGSFRVNLFDGKEWRHYTLNLPYKGLYVPPGYWRTLDNFSSGSVCMVLTSTTYSEEDYVREFDEFLKLAASR